MNWIFFGLISIAYTTTVYRQWLWSLHPTQDPAPMTLLTEQLLHAANDAVSLGIGLVGVLALFLGLMKIIEASGLLSLIAKLLSPLLQRLFPEVPASHPAMGAMVMNLSANMLGMGNAATPFGLKAMQELDKLNPHKGVASNAMILFLAINTSCVTLLPAKVIALRTAAGSTDPSSIIATTLFATLCSMTIGIIATKWLARFTPLAIEQTAETQNTPPSVWLSLFSLAN